MVFHFDFVLYFGFVECLIVVGLFVDCPKFIELLSCIFFFRGYH